VAGIHEHGKEHLGYTKRGKFIDEMSKYQLFHILCRIPSIICFNEFIQHQTLLLRKWMFSDDTVVQIARKAYEHWKWS
jgi:hypothetical protein